MTMKAAILRRGARQGTNAHTVAPSTGNKEEPGRCDAL